MKYSSKSLLILLAFAAIYITWGSTYLAISITLKDMPPFFMSALRFLVAGVLLLAWCIYKKENWPAKTEIIKSAVCGTVMLAGGTAAIAWSEQHIPSGMAAITNTTVPFWFVLLDRKQWKFYFSNKWILAGLITGFTGAVLLLSFRPMTASTSSPAMQLASIIVLIFGCGLLWATGSLYSKYKPTKLSASANICIQLLVGGLICSLISVSSENLSSFSFSRVHAQSWMAFAYLVVMGNIVAYMAYIWLLKVKPPAIVSTYAYVSPLIAVVLGWLVAGDTITVVQIVAFGIILTGVLFVNMPKYKDLFKGRRVPLSGASKVKTAMGN
ncbi:MAG TPA: EamA family transporter [Chitinophagaceae bacterium]|nr:EamA family transporter [Chitinophagaceae bacterium]